MKVNHIWALAKKDFKSYFTSPIAYIVIAGFLAIMGLMFFSNLHHFHMQNFQQMQMGRGQGISITDGIIRPLYGNMNVILLFMVPFITMRLFAEEKKLHTFELLITSPITLTEIILGKFLSSFFLILVMLTLTVVYPVVLFATGNPELGPILTSYLGTLLLASCYLAIGIWFSSMTENQIIAGALTFGAALYFWLVNWLIQVVGPVWGDILSYLSLITHFNSFSQGVLNSTDIVYYISFIGVGLFLTHRTLDSYRWR